MIAGVAIDSFSSSDGDFSNEFNSVLTDSVCNLTAHMFQPWQQAYCRNGTHYRVLDTGILAGMSLLQRTTISAVQKIMNDSSAINKT